MKSDKKQEEQLPTKETEIVEEKPKEEEKKAIDDNPLISVPPIEDPTEEKPKEESKEEKPKEVSTEEKEVPKKPEEVKPISEFELINQDPSLKNYEWNIKHRVEHFKRQLETIEKNEKSLIDFANSYKHMGLILQENNDIIYKEYAPGARGIAIFGEFNNWNRDQYWLTRDQFGFWSITLPNVDGEPMIKHNTKVKVSVVLANGNKEDRNPIWSRYLIQNKQTFLFDTVFWNPPQKYEWKSETHRPKPKSLRIYECHVGMSSNDCKVSTYREFADNVIPRIKKTGYTAIQLMAIMEHVDYASFGYHVSNFFAIASRCGTPEDLKYMIDVAHQNGLFVLIDIIYSHASSNVSDGINLWDGTDYLYFHSGPMGRHSLWDSRLFNYSSYETLRFLLSNSAFYSQEYHFDGFRFDGVTSILYKNHGIRYSFSGQYHEYFGDNFDEDGGVFLMLANYLIHKINPEAITIAEDVSGMPGLGRPIEEGGFGFDYRLNMSVSDKWIQLLKECKDEYWNMGNIAYTLTNRRYNEKHVGYSESHDQSIVGDKTISMWLFDKELYWNMSINSPETIVINRGFCLHKMIRLITFALGGEAYLNFMGNEFGHPEWVDFPRPGNGFSYHHCRRRWDLCDNKSLRYQYLYNFDVAMNNLDDVFGFLSNKHQYVTLKREGDKLIVFEKGDLLFIFNFHPYQCFDNYRIGTLWKTPHKIIMDSDEARFFGKSRLLYGHDHTFPSIHEPWMDRPNYIQLYIPSRTCIVLLAEENEDKYDLTKLIH